MYNWKVVVEWVYIAAQLICLKLANITTAAQRNQKFCFLQCRKGQFRQSSLGELPPAPMYRLSTSTTAKASHRFSSLLMQQHSVYLVCRTMHDWTDATASRQLAPTLTNGDDNFTRQVVDPAVGPVCMP